MPNGSNLSPYPFPSPFASLAGATALPGPSSEARNMPYLLPPTLVSLSEHLLQIIDEIERGTDDKFIA